MACARNEWLLLDEQRQKNASKATSAEQPNLLLGAFLGLPAARRNARLSTRPAGANLACHQHGDTLANLAPKKHRLDDWLSRPCAEPEQLRKRFGQSGWPTFVFHELRSGEVVKATWR